MKYQELFREELYEELKEYPTQIVVKDINLMSKARSVNFYMYYKKGSKANLNSSVAKELIVYIKRTIETNFVKKRFSQVFEQNIRLVKEQFKLLSPYKQNILLKEYTFNEDCKEFIYDISILDISRNKSSIETLKKSLNNPPINYQTHQRTLYEEISESREIILLAIILLEKNDQEILIYKYDEDLSRTYRIKGCNTNITAYINKSIIPKIKRNIQAIKTLIPDNILQTIENILKIVKTSQIFRDEELINRIKTLVGDYLNKQSIYEIFPDINPEIISKYFSKLYEKERKTLKKEFSIDNMQERKEEVNQEEKELNKNTIKKLRDWLETYKKYEDFTKPFKKSLEEIISKISVLNPNDKEFLEKIYDKGYENGPNIDTLIIKRNLERLNIIINRIKEITRTEEEKNYAQTDITINIFDIVNKKDIDAIRNACKKLNILNYMKGIFGEDLMQECTIKISSLKRFLMSSTVFKLNSLLDNLNKQPRFSIYEHYIAYKREDETIEEYQNRIDEIVKSIESEQILSTIYVRFYDVKHLINANIIEEQNHNIHLGHVNTHITDKLIMQNIRYTRENNLKYNPVTFKSKRKTLDSILYGGVTLEEFKEELEYYDPEIIQLFKTKYGETLEEAGKVDELNSKDNEKTYSIKDKINKKLYYKNILYNILNKFKTTEEYKSLREIFSEEETLKIMSEKYLEDLLNEKDLTKYLQNSQDDNKRLTLGGGSNGNI